MQPYHLAESRGQPSSFGWGLIVVKGDEDYKLHDFVRNKTDFAQLPRDEKMKVVYKITYPCPAIKRLAGE